MQMKLNLSLLEDISDDIDFCFKLAREEFVIILPGKKWTIKHIDYFLMAHFLIIIKNNQILSRSFKFLKKILSGKKELILIPQKEIEFKFKCFTNSIYYYW